MPASRTSRGPELGISNAKGGIDPGLLRKAERAGALERFGNSFEVIAREWHGRHAPNWTSSHADRILRRLGVDIFPWLAGRPIVEIAAPILLSALRRIESRGAIETAHRALQNCSQVFRYAVATGRAEQDLCGDLQGRYVFPGARSNGRSMSKNTVNAALRRLGYASDQMTGHGFRSMASPLLNEAGWNRDAIERRLAHAERDEVRAAYNFAEHLPERRKRMQAWADLLDEMTNPRSKVIAGCFARRA